MLRLLFALLHRDALLLLRMGGGYMAYMSFFVLVCTVFVFGIGPSPTLFEFSEGEQHSITGVLQHLSRHSVVPGGPGCCPSVSGNSSPLGHQRAGRGRGGGVGFPTGRSRWSTLAC